MDYATPRQGERLTLLDGRQFIFTAVEAHDSIRGWWWHAVSTTGTFTLQGNLRMRRQGLSTGWVQV